MPHKKAVNWVINITIITPEEKQQEFFSSRRFGVSDVTFGRRNLKQLTNLIPRCVFIIYETKKACALPHLWYYIRSLIIPPISKWKGKNKTTFVSDITRRVKAHHAPSSRTRVKVVWLCASIRHSLEFSKRKIYMGKSSRDVLLKPVQKVRVFYTRCWW
jgi:hypothetical protein